jgi:catechol 2,3-dioxygenase-like lactoylglutathione lyase family enzyme
MHEKARRPLLEPTLRGVHHLALCTDDMKATIDFYVDVLGTPLVHAMKVPPGLGIGPGNRGNPPYERVRHYFFDMGNDSLLAFFEIPKGRNQRATATPSVPCSIAPSSLRPGASASSRHELHRAASIISGRSHNSPDCSASTSTIPTASPRICLPA